MASFRLFDQAFKMHDTYGVPLSITMDIARVRGYKVDLFAFAREALAAGWKSKRVQAVIREALQDQPVAIDTTPDPGQG